MIENLLEWVESTIKRLVDLPDEVQVTSIQGAASWMIEVRVAQTDIGKVIGRKGATADSLRHLLVAVAGKDKLKVMLQLIEPDRKAAA